MNVSQISVSDSNSRNAFIKYANMFMGMRAQDDGSDESSKNANTDEKADKIKGLETLTIFPKEIIDGKIVITA